MRDLRRLNAEGPKIEPLAQALACSLIEFLRIRYFPRYLVLASCSGMRRR